MVIGLIIGGILGITLLSGFRIVRPTERAVVETFGKYSRFQDAGLTWVVPFVQRLIKVNTTEQLADVEPLDMITKDNLNARVDLQVYYKIKANEEELKKALYNVNDIDNQIISIAQTSARNIIGDMLFKDVNSKRGDLNSDLAKILIKETASWGIQIVRVELKEITPPKDVQETMNMVIKAQNEKESAVDFATAKETQADGIKRAKIKEAEGDRQSAILRAEGASKAFDLVNKSFKGNAQKLKVLEVTQNSLANNSKIVLGDNGKGILKLFDIDK